MDGSLWQPHTPAPSLYVRLPPRVSDITVRRGCGGEERLRMSTFYWKLIEA